MMIYRGWFLFAIFVVSFLYLVSVISTDLMIDPLLTNSFDFRSHLSLDRSSLFICDSIDCVNEFSAQNMHCSNKIIFAMIVTNLNGDDFMFSFFVPWVMHFFNLAKPRNIALSFLVLDTKNYRSIEELEMVVKAAEMFPICTVLNVFHCNSNGFILSPASYAINRRKKGINTNVLLHLSHEYPFPWNESDPFNMAKNCYGDPSHYGGHLYSLFNLTIRQYYYEIYDQFSHYLPLGARNFDFLRTVSLSSSLKPASLRSRQCFFSGRTTYHFETPFMQSRVEISHLIDNIQFPCHYALSDSDRFANPKLSWNEYVHVLLDSVFIPAPAGNSPETFRLFEALELQCIPILVREIETADFLVKWSNYPGPVLNNWTQLASYFYLLSMLSFSHEQRSRNDMLWIETSGFVTSIDSSFTGNTSIALCEWQTNPQTQKLSAIWLITLVEKLGPCQSDVSSTFSYENYIDFVQDEVNNWYKHFLFNQSQFLLTSIRNTFYPS